jgi:hypothetical protein|tara:strand:- start:2077 stop:2316 length:240 start_codon:yes stop_codon:yes gene_type:complete
MQNQNNYRYLVKLPFNQRTKDFVSCLRHFGKFGGGFTVVQRGSGSRAPHKRKDGLDLRHYDQSLPLKYAETIRIYLNFK